VTTSVESWCYVFGIVPAGAQVPPSSGAGPAAQLRLVESDGLAAVVGTPPTHRSLGRAADLLEHDRVLADLVASGVPVLPMRFGAVMTDEAAVAAELLAAHHDDFVEELDVLKGRVQYTVRVRYEQDAVLREVLAASPEIEQLRTPDDVDGGSFDRRLRLGELVVKALERRRPADADAVLEELGDAVDVRVRQTSSPDDVLDAAFLVDSAQAAEFERRVEKVGRDHHDRLRIRLIGPSPAYDFVGSG